MNNKWLLYALIVNVLLVASVFAYVFIVRIQKRRVVDIPDQLINDLPEGTSLYRVRLGETSYFQSAMYLNKTRLVVKNGEQEQLNLSVEDINKVYYDSRSIQLVLHNGDNIRLLYLHAPVVDTSLVSLKTSYTRSYNEPEAINALAKQLAEISIPFEKRALDGSLLMPKFAKLVLIFATLVILAGVIWNIAEAVN